MNNLTIIELKLLLDLQILKQLGLIKSPKN